jgi:exodeoxyribonuclease VII large subunit
MQVRALGRISFYEPRGELQLVVSALEAKGEGLWKLAMERLRTKLEAEGLTARRGSGRCRAPDDHRSGHLPSGAVLHDIVNVVRRRAPWTRVVLCGCGCRARARRRRSPPPSSASAGAVWPTCSSWGGAVARWRTSGRSTKRWSRARSPRPVPVISAVGHETDVTIADLVADLRAPTPSAAAEAAVPDGATIRRDIGAARGRMLSQLEARVALGRTRVLDAWDGVDGCMERLLLSRRDRLRTAARHLEALSPLSSLARGFSVALGADGRVLRRQRDFPPGSRFDLRVQDGTVACRVNGQEIHQGEHE